MLLLALLVKVSFWLLDINPKIENACGTTELWLWGIDADGNRVLVIDRNVTAYFYAVVKEGCDPVESCRGNHERLPVINSEGGSCGAPLLRQTRAGNKSLL